MILRPLFLNALALVTVALTLVTAPAIHAADDVVLIPEVSDIRADAAAAKAEGGLIVVITTQEGCVYCEIVKEDFLQPLIRSGELDGVAVVRELAMDGDSYGASFSPTVLFLSPAGEALHPPIVGVQSTDFYGYYLERAIAKAHKALGLGS